jgi:hypothetical protein
MRNITEAAGLRQRGRHGNSSNHAFHVSNRYPVRLSDSWSLQDG